MSSASSNSSGDENEGADLLLDDFMEEVLPQHIDEDNVRVMIRQWEDRLLDEMSSDEEENEENEQNENPQNFDVHIPATHNYLFHGEEADVRSSVWLDPSKSHIVPLIVLDLVVLPGQMVPIQTGYPQARYAIRKAVSDETYLGVIMSAHSDVGGYGTLLQITKMADDGYVVKVNTVGRQRFRLQHKETCINGMLLGGVEVLSEMLMPVFSRAFCPNSFLKLPEKKKLEICSSLTNVPQFVVKFTSTKNKCDLLADWMKLWYCDEKIKSSLQLGAIVFSFWVASHLPVELSTKYEFLAENSTDVRISNLLNTVMTLTDLVCKNCNTIISSMQNIVNMNSEGTSSHFVNSAGFIHEMVTVGTAENFIPRGRPESKFSWFDGYKWQIIECRTCSNHLGWEFTSRKFTPAKFYGITRTAVVPTVPENTEV